LTTAFNFQQGVQLGIGDDVHWLGQSCFEFELQTQTATLHQLHLVSIQEGGRQVKDVERITTRKVSILEVVPIVFVYRRCTRKQVEKRADVQLVFKIWGQGLGGDLLSLQKQGKKGQTMGSKIEGVLGVMPVEGGAVDQTDDDACGQLTQKEIVLHSTQVVLGMEKVLRTTLFKGYLAVPFSRALA